MVGVFVGGEGDFIIVFEFIVIVMEKEGSGYIVIFIGKDFGEIFFIVYFIMRLYMKNNKDLI